MTSARKLLILGAGQYGQVARDIALAQGGFTHIDFLDDSFPQALGKLEELERFDHGNVFVAIGNPQIRAQWVERIIQTRKLTLATLIHPRATLMPTAQIGQGSIVEPGAVVCSNSRIGTACIIMANVTVGHDASVGDFCQLKYNTSVSERSCVPSYTKLECNSLYLDRTDIEERNQRFMESEFARTGVEPGFF